MDIFAKEYDAIRDRIFDLLKEQKISQRDFARAIKVSPQTITDWKKGKSRSFSTMISVIAPALHTTPSWLYWGNGSKYFSDEDRRKLENQRAVHLRELKVELDKYNEEFKQDIIDIFKKKCILIRFGLPPLNTKVSTYWQNLLAIQLSKS